MARAHDVKEGQRNEEYYSPAFRQLVRSVQFKILPHHGFEASEKGVEEMLVAFKLLESNQDVFVQSVAIQDALSSACPASKTVVQEVSRKPGGMKPDTAVGMARLLRCQLVRFSTPHFQRRIAHLKREDCLKRAKPNGCADKSQGWYQLPGRAEVALREQRDILSAFGFEDTREGVQDMIIHCAQFLKDPQITSLLDSVNEKLGMSPEACLRFRRLAESLAAPPLCK
jgi:hypothetical protein